VLGSARPSDPARATFSALLVQRRRAQAPKPLRLANAGGGHLELAQAGERVRNLEKRQKLLALIIGAKNSVRALGLPALGKAFWSLLPFYWDMNERDPRPFRAALCRATSQAQTMPNDMGRRGVYARRPPLPEKAVDKVGGATDGKAVVAANGRAMPTNDLLFGPGTIRPGRARKVHPMYLFQVKSPDESKGAVGRLQGDGDHPRRIQAFSAAAGGRLSAWSPNRRRRRWR